MHLSIHYYVLLLSEKFVKLFEGFRDTLIEIENGEFPFIPATNPPYPAKPMQRTKQLKAFYKRADRLFAKFYDQDPLNLILVGKKVDQSIFISVTAHENDIVSTVETNNEAISPNDLGQIVWFVLKEALAGTREKALRELDVAVRTQKVVSGLGEVWRMANSGLGATLLVEEDYHMKGSIVQTHASLIISEEVNIYEVFDDVVDKVIEKVLELNGTLIFMNSGSLAAYQKIALILRS